MKAKTQVYLVGKTATRSGAKKDGKYMYMFIDGERDEQGMFIQPTALTYWSEEDFQKIPMFTKFIIEFELFGENIVVRSAVPVK